MISISFLLLHSASCQIISGKPKDLLIKGYDPVSYFSGNPQKGSSSIITNYNGTNIWFVNEKNKAAFLKNPEKYFPKYGGWCAYAMGLDGSKVDVNPLTYEIREDGLYLFYNKLGTNTLVLWNKENPEALKKKADENWKILKDKSPNNR